MFEMYCNECVYNYNLVLLVLSVPELLLPDDQVLPVHQPLHGIAAPTGPSIRIKRVNIQLLNMKSVKE